MKLCLSAAAISFLPSLALAEIVVTKTFSVPIDFLDSVALKLQTAGDRPSKQHAAVYFFDEGGMNVPAALACGPALPDAEGRGCKLNFPGPAAPDAFRLTVLKDVHLTTVKASAESLRKQLEAASSPAEDHVNVFYPFSLRNGAKDDATHVFCDRTNGAVPNPRLAKWTCSLTVRDSL